MRCSPRSCAHRHADRPAGCRPAPQAAGCPGRLRSRRGRRSVPRCRCAAAPALPESSGCSRPGRRKARPHGLPRRPLLPAPAGTRWPAGGRLQSRCRSRSPPRRRLHFCRCGHGSSCRWSPHGLPHWPRPPPARRGTCRRYTRTAPPHAGTAGIRRGAGPGGLPPRDTGSFRSRSADALRGSPR